MEVFDDAGGCDCGIESVEGDLRLRGLRVDDETE